MVSFYKTVIKSDEKGNTFFFSWTLIGVPILQKILYSSL